MKRLVFLFFLASVLTVSVFAQMADPVHFTASMKMLGGDEAEIVFSAKIDKGWHLYSTDLGSDGPTQATFNVNKMSGAEPVGKLRPVGKEIAQFDEMFGMKLRFFENSGSFVQKIKFTKAEYTIDCYLEYGACNDEMCMPPSQVAFVKSGKSPAIGKSDDVKADDKVADALKQDTVVAEKQDTAATDTTVVAAAVAHGDKDLWTPVIDELKAYEDNPTDNSLLYIFLAGFAGGFLALLTPCVWPFP